MYKTQRNPDVWQNMGAIRMFEPFAVETTSFSLTWPDEQNMGIAPMLVHARH